MEISRLLTVLETSLQSYRTIPALKETAHFPAVIMSAQVLRKAVLLLAGNMSARAPKETAHLPAVIKTDQALKKAVLLPAGNISAPALKEAVPPPTDFIQQGKVLF